MPSRWFILMNLGADISKCPVIVANLVLSIKICRIVR